MDNEKPNFSHFQCESGAVGGELVRNNSNVSYVNESKYNVTTSKISSMDEKKNKPSQSMNHHHHQQQQQSQFVPSPLQLQVQELEALYKETIESKMRGDQLEGQSYMFHHHENYNYSSLKNDHYTTDYDDMEDSSPPPLFHISSTNEDDEDHCINSMINNEKITDHPVSELNLQDEINRHSNYFTSTSSTDTLPPTFEHHHHHHQQQNHHRLPSTYEADHSYEHVYTNFNTIDSEHSSVVTSMTSPLTIATLPCFTCCSLKKCGFFCFSCVQLGKFTSSKSPGPLKFTFFEKKYEYLHLQNEKASLNTSIGFMLKSDHVIDDLQEKVNQAKKRNELLKQKLKEATENLANKKSQIIDMSPLKKTSNESMKKKRSKMDFAKNYFGRLKSKLETKSNELKSIQSQIKVLTWNLAVDLRNSIFAIESYDELTGEGQFNNPSADLDLRMPLLTYLNSMDATNINSTLRPLTSWSNQIKYTIVEPWVYGNIGDLVMYDNWMNGHKDDFSSTNSVMDVTSGNEGGNDALRVTAALTYLNHMLDVMAKLLDLKLPRKLQLNEFYLGNEASYSTTNYNQMKFRLAKLNVNIIYLCLSQKLDTNLVGTQVRSPLQSLIHLLNPSFDADLGRRGPLSTDAIELIDSTVESEFLNDLSLFHEPVYLQTNDYLDMATDPEDLGFENISVSAIELFPHATASANVTDSPSTLFGINSYFVPATAFTIHSLINRLLPIGYVSATTTATTATTTTGTTISPTGHSSQSNRSPSGSNASSPASPSSSFNPPW